MKRTVRRLFEEMIKRILLALDPDSDTPVATHFAQDIGRRSGAVVTGLAVVDLGSIEADTKGGGIGSFYYAEKLREKLTADTRSKARELIDAYMEAMEGSGIEHGELVQEGVPFQRIVEDMKYHDLLVMGKDPHFFYGHPERATHTVARVVKNTVAPTLIVGKEYREIERVVVAFDGSAASARALREFVRQQPFGSSVVMTLLGVYEKDSTESELRLNLADAYAAAHGIAVKTVNVASSNVAQTILEYVENVSADLLVMGAHSVSAIKRIAFGSTTDRLLKECPLPLFIDS